METGAWKKTLEFFSLSLSLSLSTRKIFSLIGISHSKPSISSQILLLKLSSNPTWGAYTLVIWIVFLEHQFNCYNSITQPLYPHNFLFQILVYNYTHSISCIVLSCIKNFITISELLSFIPFPFYLPYIAYTNSSSFHYLNQLHALACQGSYIAISKLCLPLILKKRKEKKSWVFLFFWTNFFSHTHPEWCGRHCNRVVLWCVA